ncbi:MAG TPA: PPC domain-containing protein [Leptolyngbyaceae cyanobacterium]
MISNPSMTSSVLAVLIVLGGGNGLPAGEALTQPQRLAQVIANSVTGELHENSPTLNDGDYYNTHSFTGSAGDIVAIELTSEDFNAYLILQGPEGETIAQNADDEGINSRIVAQLPETGTYQIVVTTSWVIALTSWARATGRYTLNWRPATAAELDRLLSKPNEVEDSTSTPSGLELD